ncbi:hypothetical protein [Desulfosarcina widdelii]|uniref:hypothetical protein n=1 Tax=Desulfosarcina widdelii TaxID=947919 RepID=UPI001E447099|nr:hypothetical protein [Desulfosarcina widdelii]
MDMWQTVIKSSWDPPASEIGNQQLLSCRLFVFRNRILQTHRLYFKIVENLPDIWMVIDANDESAGDPGQYYRHPLIVGQFQVVFVKGAQEQPISGTRGEHGELVKCHWLGDAGNWPTPSEKLRQPVQGPTHQCTWYLRRRGHLWPTMAGSKGGW